MHVKAVQWLQVGLYLPFVGGMGMYTELVLGVNLNRETPAEVIDVLKFMVGDSETEPNPLPAHPLFSCFRWKYMLQCGSYYFAGGTHTAMNQDSVSGGWSISIRCNLKNYESEIEKFVDWIKPYIGKPYEGEFMGYMRYEESEEPTLLFNK